TRAAGEAVGAHAIDQGTLALGGNYTLTYIGADLTITPAQLTVTAADTSRAYGDANPTVGYTVSGFVGSDTSAVVSGTASCATSGSAGPNAGTYPGANTCSIGTLSATNYTFGFAPGTLTIAKRAVTVTAAAKTKVYGTVDPALTYAVTSGSVASGDSF